MKAAIQDVKKIVEIHDQQAFVAKNRNQLK